MYRKSYNRAVLRVRITTVTPLRIGAGDVGLDPSGADLTCVRTRHATHGATVYIPGSSLKGVVRASAEASVRGQRVAGRLGACDDSLDPINSCTARLSSGRSVARDTPTHEIYKAHCLACRLFGSQQLKGRASLRDLFPWSDDPGADATFAPRGENEVSANRLELRHGVAIDRILGSVRRGSLFDQELVPAGVAFFGDIALENYQLWQLGLIAVAFDQLNSGIAQLGSSKSRGLGVVRVVVEEIVHEQAGREPRPCGVGALATPEERMAYDLTAEPPLPAAEGVPHGLATRFIVRSEADTWLGAARNALGGLQ
ncbi:MAG TPA: CRISPR-associated RAMP protein Csx7 [Kofleriaceae bacterium]|nr:CRISPR-associated RAMP protein Csx7 [Kofleriaceae bacterium]